MSFYEYDPYGGSTETTILLLRITSILTRHLCRLPTNLTILRIITIRTLNMILIRYDLRQGGLFRLLTREISILLLRGLNVRNDLVNVLEVSVPNTRCSIIRINGEGSILMIRVLLIYTLTRAGLIMLDR